MPLSFFSVVDQLLQLHQPKHIYTLATLVARGLLQIHAIMERGEVHYLLNKLFIEDYCVWIQKVGVFRLLQLECTWLTSQRKRA